MNTMRIMTFNTQHCMNFYTEEIDFQIMADEIKKYDPDIVGLNEIRDKGSHFEYEAQTKILSDLTGLKNFYFAKAIEFEGNNPYGNGFLSKIPIVSAETIIVPDPEPKAYDDYYETRCLLKAKLENGFTVLVIHFGLNRDEQINAVETVVKNLEDEKCILMGDFNVEPDSDVLIPIKEKMKDTVCKADGASFTYPADNPDRKIDYIFVSRDIEVISSKVSDSVASDHRAYIAQIS